MVIVREGCKGFIGVKLKSLILGVNGDGIFSVRGVCGFWWSEPKGRNRQS